MSYADSLLALLLAGHLWSAGAAVFAPCFTAICEIAESRGWRDLGVLGRIQARLGIVALILSGLLGLVYGTLIWNASLSDALARLQSRVIFGTIEWLFSLMLVIICLVWWQRRPEANRVERGLRVATVLLAATNLAYHFPVFFEVLTNLRAEGVGNRAPLASAEFREWLIRPRVLSQVMHFWLASVLAGASMLVLAMKISPDGWQRPLGNLVQRLVGAIVVVASGLQLIVGTWVTANVSPGQQFQLTQFQLPKAWVFLSGVLIGVALIPHGVALLFGARRRHPPLHIVYHVGIIFYLMAFLTRILKA